MAFQLTLIFSKVAGETEVKAQIKLRFRTATSQPVVVIRTFQVSMVRGLITTMVQAIQSIAQTNSAIFVVLNHAANQSL